MTFDPQKIVAFDTETHLIQPGILAPPLVCASVATPKASKLLDKEEALAVFQKLINSDAILAGANLPYDVLVCAMELAKRGIDILPAVFAKYERGEMFDVQVALALHCVALGCLGMDPRTYSSIKSPSTGKISNRYSLECVVDIVLGRTDAKANDYWRLRYALLENIPISEWPIDARTYPIDDAVNTRDAAVALVSGDYQNTHDVQRQVYFHFCAHLGAAWGLPVNPAKVLELEARAREKQAKNVERFKGEGFYRTGKNGEVLLTEKGNPKKDTAVIKRLVCRAYGAHGQCGTCEGRGRVPGLTKCKGCDGAGCAQCAGSGKVPHPKNTKNCTDCGGTGFDIDSAPLPRTEGGDVSIGADALSESGDDLLMEYAASLQDQKVLTTYVPFLKKGIAEDG